MAAIIVCVGASVLLNKYIENTWPLHVADINCTGNESLLLDCPHNGVGIDHHCTALDDAGVICQCESIQHK